MANTMLTDGFKTIFTLSSPSGVKLEEITVKPVGLDKGGEIDTSSMRNVLWRTKAGKTLINVPPISATCKYDPEYLDQIIDTAAARQNQSITITYPNGDTVQFWGVLDKAVPSDHKEGDLPTMSVEFIVTNTDADGDEAGPVWTAAGA